MTTNSYELNLVMELGIVQTVKLTVVFAVVLFKRVTKQFGVTVVICGSIMNAHSLQKLSMKLYKLYMDLPEM